MENQVSNLQNTIQGKQIKRGINRELEIQTIRISKLLQTSTSTIYTSHEHSETQPKLNYKPSAKEGKTQSNMIKQKERGK